MMLLVCGTSKFVVFYLGYKDCSNGLTEQWHGSEKKHLSQNGFIGVVKAGGEKQTQAR